MSIQSRHPEVAEPQPNRSMQDLECYPAFGSSESINVYLSRKGRTLREEWIDSGSESGMTQNCHCEERSDEAIQETKFSVGKINTKTELLTFGLPRFARNDKRAAFTLAEVLITLAIIGVVATMTIPTLVAEYQQKSWDTATSVFNRRLGEALKIMNANGSLSGYNSTEDFVAELGKHIKISKTCSKDKLSDCFVSEILTTADPVETSKLQSAKNLNSTADPEYGTDTMGVMFADGVTALVAYNKNTPYDPYSNEIVNVSGTGKDVSLATKAVSILYDVNGLKSPNEMDTMKDIRGINVSIKTGAAVKVIGTSYTAVDCSSAGASNDDYKYCTDGDKSSAYTSNYWAGAKKACAEQGMSLPELGSYNTSTYYCNSDAAENTLCGLYNNREALGLPTSGWFWSASESSTDGAWVVVFSVGYVATAARATATA